MTNPSPKITAQSQLRISSWIFGGVSFVFLIGVFMFAPAVLPPFKHQLLGLFAGLCGGFLGYFLTGSLGIDGTANLKPFGKLGIKAGGGLALFVLILLWWSSDASPIRSLALRTFYEQKYDRIRPLYEEVHDRFLVPEFDKQRAAGLSHAGEPAFEHFYELNAKTSNFYRRLAVPTTTSVADRLTDVQWESLGKVLDHYNSFLVFVNERKSIWPMLPESGTGRMGSRTDVIDQWLALAISIQTELAETDGFLQAAIRSPGKT